jgi:3-oxoacyl-[acyl-carrier-protein] synthase-3
MGVSEQWIYARTGIRERRRAAADERLSDYAIRAAAAALVSAEMHPEHLDLVVVATNTPDDLQPNVAPNGRW